MQIMQQQGISVDVRRVIELISSLEGYSDLESILVSGAPTELGDGPVQPWGESGGDNVTHNVRHNVSTGGTPAGREASLIQAMLGGGPMTQGGGNQASFGEGVQQ